MYKMYMTPNLSAIARPKGVARLDKVIWHYCQECYWFSQEEESQQFSLGKEQEPQQA